ncbi:MAG: flagellar basal body-associated protein [Edaphobacter sp.]|nr:flagellar basal body-associated protein [Edaphobacter sp.]
MATSSPVVQGSSVSEPVKLPVGTLLIAVVLGVVVATLGVGGIVYYLARSGRLPMQSGATAKAEPPGVVATHAMVLDPLLVNLADSGGNAYLRVGLTLRVADVADKNGAKPKEEKSSDGKGGKDGEPVAAVRDTALAVLGRQTSEELLATDGKERLKSELKTALAAHNVELKVTDLFFTEFLVQR